jgi:hypothetical protein
VCYLWEKYHFWSQGQLPLNYSRRSWHVLWKKSRYSNEKLRNLLGWAPKVSTFEGMERYFQSCREKLSVG